MGTTPSRPDRVIAPLPVSRARIARPFLDRAFPKTPAPQLAKVFDLHAFRHGPTSPWNLRLVVPPSMLSLSETRTTLRSWGQTLMGINRRSLLASGTTLAGLSVLRGETTALGAGHADVPRDAVVLTAMVKAKTGQEDAIKEALLSLVEPTRKEPGCLCYNLHQSKADPTQFMFYEQWASKEDLDSHGKSPHMKALGGKLKDKTDRGGVVVLYELLK